MSTLVGIKRKSESGLGPISKEQLLDVVEHDASLAFEKDGVPGLSWSGDEKNSGMEFNFQEGEIWSAGSVDDATLRKMQDIAVRLRAKLVSEEGEFFDLDEPATARVREPASRGKIVFRVYAVALVVALVLFCILRM